MKVFVLAPNENWILDRMVKEWYTYNPKPDINTHDPHEADVLWLMAGFCWNHIPQQLLEQKRVIVSIHHIDPNKFDVRAQQEFLLRDKYVDAYHVPNDTTKATVEQLTSKPVIKIGYWYDPKIWKSFNKQNCRDNHAFDEELSNYLVVGSFQRDSEGGSNKPKLSKGPDIFCEQIEILAKQQKVHVILAGPRRSYVGKRLSDSRISFSYYDYVTQSALCELYNALDVYLVTSRYEGGPQAILEAAAMKVPILSTDVGMARDVLCDNCIIDMPVDELQLPTKDDIEMNFQRVQKYNIEVISQEYIEMLEAINV